MSNSTLVRRRWYWFEGDDAPGASHPVDILGTPDEASLPDDLNKAVMVIDADTVVSIQFDGCGDQVDALVPAWEGHVRIK